MKDKTYEELQALFSKIERELWEEWGASDNSEVREMLHADYRALARLRDEIEAYAHKMNS